MVLHLRCQIVQERSRSSKKEADRPITRSDRPIAKACSLIFSTTLCCYSKISIYRAKKKNIHQYWITQSGWGGCKLPSDNRANQSTVTITRPNPIFTQQIKTTIFQSDDKTNQANASDQPPSMTSNAVNRRRRMPSDPKFRRNFRRRKESNATIGQKGRSSDRKTQVGGRLSKPSAGPPHLHCRCHKILRNSNRRSLRLFHHSLLFIRR